MAIPFRHSTAGVTGRGDGVSVPVGGIKSGDTLLAVISHNAATNHIQGRDPAAFVVSDGAIESETVDTDGLFLHLIWYDAP